MSSLPRTPRGTAKDLEVSALCQIVYVLMLYYVERPEVILQLQNLNFF